MSANLVGEKGKVYAFEPDEKNYSLLLKNIKLNNYKNVIPLKMAISDKNGYVDFFLRENTAVHSLLNNFKKYPSKKVIKVQTTTIDEFFKNNSLKSNIKLIKMDIEGAEMLALLGMSSILKINKKLSIISEFNPDFIRKSGYSPEEFISKLKYYDFQIKIIGDKKCNDIINIINEISPESGINLFCYKNH